MILLNMAGLSEFALPPLSVRPFAMFASLVSSMPSAAFVRAPALMKPFTPMYALVLCQDHCDRQQRHKPSTRTFYVVFCTKTFTYPSAILVHASVVQALPAPAIFLEVVEAFGNASERTGGAGAHAFLIYEELHEEVPVHMA